MITRPQPAISAATLGDVDPICKLIDANRFREDGTGALLAVRPEQVRAIVRDRSLGSFFVALGADGEVAGCVSVVVYGLPPDYNRVFEELGRRLAGPGVKRHFSAISIPAETGASETKVAELRSLAAHEGYRGSGLGLRLIQAAKDEARARGFNVLYSLVNERVAPLFQRGGFQVAERTPQKLIVDCTKCPILERCNEVPVVVEVG